jgi:hypothetical protein
VYCPKLLPLHSGLEDPQIAVSSEAFPADLKTDLGIPDQFQLQQPVEKLCTQILCKLTCPASS